MILIGDTIRLNASFYTFAGALADPDVVTVKIYSYIGKNVLATGTATKSSTGVYYYDYTVPDEKGDLVYEFSGTLENLPSVGRARIEKQWI